MTLERFLPLPEASARWKISEPHLRALLQSGKIRGGILSNGEIVVNAQDAQARVPKEELPEYRKHTHLKGRPIWINEASRQYKISPPTLTRWTKAGIVRRLSTDGYRVYVNEQDVAYCADIYHQRGKQGRKLFNPDGTLHKPKTDHLAQQ